VRFLISGYYGFGNLGDEALLAQIVSQLKTRYPAAEIDVLSAKPGETAVTYGVEATARMELGAVKRAIERSDVVLSGGGGLLQNATSLKSLLYYANILRGGAQAHKKTMIFAQSIGPLDFWGKQTVRACCSGVTAATVRDEGSRELLASLLPNVPLQRTADLVFLYEPPAVAPDLSDAGLGPESDPLVIVAVRKTARFDDAAVILANAVDVLTERYGARVAFLPFGGEADADAATVVIRKCRTKPVLVALESLDAVAAAIARAKFVFGMRLHSLILAARFGVPFLALAYDPKVQALCDDLAYPLAPLWTPGQRAVDPAAVALAATTAWERRAELAAHLNERLPAVRVAAAANFTALERMLA
jgi:polysaccharide pyruvyl transferase CsaB